MAKVYVVEDGDYSDRRIEGIFSTFELANKYQALMGGQITEWDLDTGLEEYQHIIARMDRGFKFYYVKIRLDNAQIREIITTFWSEDRECAKEWREMDNERYSFKCNGWQENCRYDTIETAGEKFDVLCMYAWAKSDEHAAKIAAEKRAVYLELNGMPQIKKDIPPEYIIYGGRVFYRVRSKPGE